MLEVRGLEVSYGEFLALKGISFTVDDGELVTIIGANGSGKSSILRTVMGLVKSRKGDVLFKRRDISITSPHQRARMGISLVPEGRKIFPDLTVTENLLMGAYTQQDKRTIEASKEEVFGLFPVSREKESGG